MVGLLLSENNQCLFGCSAAAGIDVFHARFRPQQQRGSLLVWLPGSLVRSSPGAWVLQLAALTTTCVCRCGGNQGGGINRNTDVLLHFIAFLHAASVMVACKVLQYVRPPPRLHRFIAFRIKQFHCCSSPSEPTLKECKQAKQQTHPVGTVNPPIRPTDATHSISAAARPDLGCIHFKVVWTHQVQVMTTFPGFPT